jgi:hypothetical protein
MLLVKCAACGAPIQCDDSSAAGTISLRDVQAIPAEGPNFSLDLQKFGGNQDTSEENVEIETYYRVIGILPDGSPSAVGQLTWDEAKCGEDVFRRAEIFASIRIERESSAEICEPNGHIPAA